jgi:hypothetical protein
MLPVGIYQMPPPIPLTTDGVYPGMNENVKEQVARTLQEFGLEPRGRGRTYHKPHLDFFNIVPYPRGCSVPEFVRFTGEDSRSTYEHIGQFLAQVSDYGITDMHKI